MLIKQYIYKDEIYEVIDANLTMKEPTTRKWIPAVSYHNINKPEIKCVREKSEFLKRFVLYKEKKVKPEPSAI